MSQSQPASNPAQVYEDYFVPAQFRPWAEELLERAPPRNADRVLDLACATGIVARLAAQRLDGQGHVVGLDVSQQMLDVARAVSVRDGVAITWQEGSAEALPFPDGSFDLVLVQQGLQYFADRDRAVQEMERVLKPGGRVASATWTAIENNPLSAVFGEIVRRHVGFAGMHTPFSLGDRNELHALFQDSGFEHIQIEVVRRPVRWRPPSVFAEVFVAGGTAAVPALQAMDDVGRRALVEAVRSEMDDTIRYYTEGDAVVYPMEAHIVVGRKCA